MRKEPTWAGLFGNGLALAQHAVDSFCQWGFQQARKLGGAKESEKLAREHPYLHRASRAGKGLLSFVGEVGDSFYEEYAKLKKPDER